MTRVTVGHSPDADDAYMFYALAHGKVTVEGLDPGGYAEVHADIQALNRRALAGDLDMSQVSAGAYPYVADQYRITACGASMGLNYGPIVVARDAKPMSEMRGSRFPASTPRPISSDASSFPHLSPSNWRLPTCCRRCGTDR